MCAGQPGFAAQAAACDRQGHQARSGPPVGMENADETERHRKEQNEGKKEKQGKKSRDEDRAAARSCRWPRSRDSPERPVSFQGARFAFVLVYCPLAASVFFFPGPGWKRDDEKPPLSGAYEVHVTSLLLDGARPTVLYSAIADSIDYTGQTFTFAQALAGN